MTLTMLSYFIVLVYYHINIYYHVILNEFIPQCFVQCVYNPLYCFHQLLHIVNILFTIFSKIMWTTLLFQFQENKFNIHAAAAHMANHMWDNSGLRTVSVCFIFSYYMYGSE